MSDLVLIAGCPRCGAENMTFDLGAWNPLEKRYEWQLRYDVFSICRNCVQSTIFIVSMRDPHPYLFKNGLGGFSGSVNRCFDVEGFVSLKDQNKREPPAHLPLDILNAFVEGSTCLSVNCFNAAGTMFRLCIDLATAQLLPSGEVEGLNQKTRRDLGLRLPWLFDNGQLPHSLRDLSLCIKDDGNDGAHRGSLKSEDAEDLFDFTFEILDKVFTEPERIKIAQQRRVERRQNNHK